jgi:hypothetical protein
MPNLNLQKTQGLMEDEKNEIPSSNFTWCEAVEAAAETAVCASLVHEEDWGITI